LPATFADVLITSHALGWQLEAELREFERVVKPGGFVIHCPGTAEIPGEQEQHNCLISHEWGYRFARYREADGWKRKYWKLVSAAGPEKTPVGAGFTRKQGQYLAFINYYTKLHGQPPAEADMQAFFCTSPPSVHQMVVRLEALGLISKVSGQARTIKVLLPPDQLPELE
jgi:repressor LexA